MPQTLSNSILMFLSSFVDRDMFTRHLGNGIGHQCQHMARNEVVNDGENEDDISHEDDCSDDGNCADEDVDSDGSDSTDELEDIEEDNTEEGDEFSDEDDTGYDDL
jgi:hypothetical protein